MPHKPTLPELYAKRDKNQKYFAKLAQRQHALGDKIKADEKLMDSYTRRERTHRLCTRAGMLESFLLDPEALTNDQVMALLRIAFEQEPVKEALKKVVTGSLFGPGSRYDRSMRRNYTPFRCNCALRGYLRFSFAAERANR